MNNYFIVVDKVTQKVKELFTWNDENELPSDYPIDTNSQIITTKNKAYFCKVQILFLTKQIKVIKSFSDDANIDDFQDCFSLEDRNIETRTAPEEVITQSIAEMQIDLAKKDEELHQLSQTIADMQLAGE